MEEFIQILFFLIIIISFLSSILKKKEPPGGKAPSQRTQSTDITGYPEAKTSSEDYDILTEIETLFKSGEESGIKKPTTLNKPSMEKTPIEENRRSPSETTSYERERSFSEHVAGDYTKSGVPSQRDVSEYTSTSSEHTMGDWWESKKIKDKKRQLDSIASAKAEKFEKLLSKKREEENLLTKNLMQRFRNPSTLKEYIIISEIIGKPKSLQ
jgi:hypothetical protein